MASSLVNINTMYSRRLCRPCRCCTWRSDFVMVIPAEAVRQWVVVFPMRLRYFMNYAAGCLNRVAGIALREVQRATAGASTSTAARSYYSQLHLAPN